MVAWGGVFFGFIIAINRQTISEELYWYAPSSITQDFYEQQEGTGITVQRNTKIQYAYFDSRVTESDTIPIGVELITPGAREITEISFYSINREKSHKLWGDISYNITDSIPQVVTEGSLSQESFNAEIAGIIDDALAAAVNQDSELLEKLFADYNAEVDLAQNRTVAEASISSVDILTGTKIADPSARIGKATIAMGTCEKIAIVNILINNELEKLYFTQYAQFIANLCPKTGLLGFVFEQSCEECTYYPVDRYNPLPSSDYKPSDIIFVADIPGGQYISARAYGDLQALYQAAFNAGYYMSLTSGYRSYGVQQNTFEGWVQYEIANNGYDRATAESIAGQYSARPGYSEHQLGTTVDIGAQYCAAFATDCNGTLWEWLAVNSYKFGFIMSYPPGTQDKTGYVHEPWHYRWIGREYAAEYDQVKDQYVLSEWLKLKNDGII